MEEDEALEGENEDAVEEDGGPLSHSEEEEEEEEEGDEETEEEEEVLVKKELPKRESRGQRMGRLVGDAAEADEAFWGQAAFNEDESDESVSADDLESSSGSDTDSDIDLPEPEDDDGGGRGGRGGARGRGGRAGSGGGGGGDVDDEPIGRGGKGGRGGRAAYSDPALKALKGMGEFSAAVAKLAASAGAGAGGSASTAALSTDGISSRVRKRPQGGSAEGAGVVEGGEEGEGKGAKKKAKTESEEAPPPRLSQEEVLIDGASTTVESLRVLEGMVRWETERAAREAADAARRGVGRAFPAGTPLLRFHSKRGAPDTLTFTEVDAAPNMGWRGVRGARIRRGNMTHSGT